jgi:hypothetical protein
MSDGIGQFIVGQSPIGGSPFNYGSTIISQYANSATLVQLIESFADYIDPTYSYDDFYDLIWNVATAQGYGLDIWGRIVGVTRILQVSDGPNLGLTGPSGNSGDSLNVAPFYSGTPITSNYSLSDDAFRTLIYAKALANISNGSTPSINAILMALFGSGGNVYVTDGGGLTMTYTFSYVPSLVDQAIVEQSGAIPRPSGVALTMVIP